MSSNSVVLRSLRRITIAFASVATSMPIAHAQGAQPSGFQVASVRLVAPYSQAELNSGAGLISWSDFPAHRFYAHHLPLNLLLSLAYGVQQKNIDALPNWAEEQCYDIEANVEGNQSLTYEQMKPLIQRLLQQRLHLAAHLEMRRTPGYNLVIANSAAKLTPSAGDAKSTPFIFPDRLVARGLDLTAVADLLGHSLGDPVVNQTDISGKYDIDLHFRRANDMESSLPDIFTAVREQLGLKLVRTTVPTQHLVIDHVNRVPTEN